jgi:hypothetical protein
MFTPKQIAVGCGAGVLLIVGSIFIFNKPEQRMTNVPIDCSGIRLEGGSSTSMKKGVTAVYACGSEQYAASVDEMRDNNFVARTDVWIFNEDPSGKYEVSGKKASISGFNTERFFNKAVCSIPLDQVTLITKGKPEKVTTLHCKNVQTQTKGGRLASEYDVKVEHVGK